MILAAVYDPGDFGAPPCWEGRLSALLRDNQGDPALVEAARVGWRERRANGAAGASFVLGGGAAPAFRVELARTHA